MIPSEVGLKSAIVRGLLRGELVSVRKIQPLGAPSETYCSGLMKYEIFVIPAKAGIQ